MDERRMPNDRDRHHKRVVWNVDAERAAGGRLCATLYCHHVLWFCYVCEFCLRVSRTRRIPKERPAPSEVPRGSSAGQFGGA